MSEGLTPMNRRTGALRSLWTQSDFTVCKIISQLAKSRMQIFTYKIQQQQKEKMKSRVIRFVGDFI